MKHLTIKFVLASAVLAVGCGGAKEKTVVAEAIKPVIVTETTLHDTDDPAIWINPSDPSKSMIIGTDKDVDGALYAFDLEGKIIPEKTVKGLKRPNNVDIAYGLVVAGDTLDIAVTGERFTHNMRIFSLPDMKPIDGGGIPVFEGETGVEFRDLMGVALYKRPSDGAIFAIMGRKTGPMDGSYLWQYLLEGTEDGTVQATLVRKFGLFSGIKEIEAIAVDHELGYVYYSDETVGVRKYYADPDKGNEELALFGTTGFTRDNEGISIFDNGEGKGFILVSDQQANQFQVFQREGTSENPHQHNLLKVIKVSTNESDGSEISNVAFNATFKNGIFVAMSDNRTFQYYSIEDILGELFQK
ncbi:MAG: 3-phytase [Cytophagales bacterium CG12_big_fil_rev_8_21_14_0_65_40_12]|nr:MAG: 3-phytase [Cytophagales bacterium CG12_big_fil_rev_8_21_14_0_65_40_12]PIW06050.1 MAG: 3-phytase [Cytophagales bacterium CG17_big_fil_post_rev_8_21_14_2_50_40_13]